MPAHHGILENSSQWVEEFKAVMDTIPSAIIIAHDPESKVITGNAMANEMFEGQEGENLSGGPTSGTGYSNKRRFFRDGRELRPDELPLRHAALAGIEVRDTEMEILLPSGRRRILTGNAFPLFDAHGHVRGAIGSFVDITERRNTEQALKESEARYRSLFRENSAPMLLIDPATGDIVDANQAACEYYGYEHENLLGMKISQINILDPDEVRMEMSRSVSGEKRKFDFRHRLASGEVRDVDVYSGPVHIQGRQLLYSIIHDVTDRKLTEGALRESERKYRGLFENIQEVAAIYGYTYDGCGQLIDATLLDANPLWLKAKKTDLKEVQGKRLSELFSGEYFETTIQIFRQMKATRKPIVLERAFPPEGPESRSSFFPLDEDHFVVTAIDISVIKKAQQMAEEYSKRLEQSNAELQQFAYVASHDLKEPLRMVTGYLQLLERKYQDQLDPTAQQYIRIAVDGGTRMRDLIDDLLQYSRIDAKGKEFTLVDMNAVIGKIHTILKVPIEESGAELIIGPLPTVLADESQMVQVMQNLIANAIKFRGPERPIVRISASRNGREWTFAVKDNGIGLTAADSDRIFQMFQRLHTREEYSGTGIGLAISKKIVERHGGRIWFESDGHSGSTFFFTIPV